MNQVLLLPAGNPELTDTKTCTRCGIQRPKIEFPSRSYKCKACWSIWQRDYRRAHYNELLVRRNNYRTTHIRTIKVSKKISRRKHLDNSPHGIEIRHAKQRYYHDTHREAESTYRKKYYEKTREQRLAYNKRIRTEMKVRILTYYGNNQCACIQCGFSDVRALSIDHINGGGTQHVKNRDRASIYNWLIRHNFPEGYQTLCMNCQFIKRQENGEQTKNARQRVKDLLDNVYESKPIGVNK